VYLTSTEGKERCHCHQAAKKLPFDIQWRFVPGITPKKQRSYLRNAAKKAKLEIPELASKETSSSHKQYMVSRLKKSYKHKWTRGDDVDQKEKIVKNAIHDIDSLALRFKCRSLVSSLSI